MKNKNTKPKLKARRMWANYYKHELVLVAVHKTRRQAQAGSGGCAFAEAVPVAVIPLDDVGALVARAADAFYEVENRRHCEGSPVTYGECLRAALTAIGVLPRARAKKGCK